MARFKYSHQKIQRKGRSSYYLKHTREVKVAPNTWRAKAEQKRLAAVNPNLKTETLNGITLVNICHLSDFLGLTSAHSYEEETAAIKKWVSENNAAYYSAQKEDFSPHAAADLAIRDGKTTVVMESLS